MAAESRLDPRTVAVRAYHAGLAPWAPREDGTKTPDTNRWKQFQSERPDRETLRALYAVPRDGVGLFTGRAGGNLTGFEFDDADVYEVFHDTAEAADLGELVERVEAGYLERSPRGGFHWLYRCDEVLGNTTLAAIPGQPATTLIQTRGEGGWIVIAPSGGRVHENGGSYELLRGSVETIATITPDEQRALWELARAFDQRPRQEYRAPAEPAPIDGNRPGDDFNRRASWDDILTHNGWTFVYRRGEISYWRRPGKQVGVSATTNYGGYDLLYVFTSSTVFEPERGYSKYRAYALLEHGGDWAAAARALGQQGYGEQRAAGSGPRLVLSTNGVHEPGSSEAGQERPCFDLSDTGNAERLIHQHGDELRYVKLWNVWLVWDGRYWRRDETGEVGRRAKATVRSIAAEAAQLEEAGDDEYKRVLKWAMSSQSERARRAMVNLAEMEAAVAITPDVLDRDPWLLALNNGTLDLRTGMLLPHCKADLITRMVPIDFDPDATCATFSAFLKQITAHPQSGSPRPELEAFLQRAAGYSLTANTAERVMFILHGTGANGKSTFLDALRKLLGDYAMRVPTDTLMARRGETIPNDIARMKGARFVFAAETDEGKRLSEALIKDLTGGDMISARFMRGEWFDFKPEFKVWLATNHRPTIRGTDKAIWDRIRLVPFEISIPEHQQDKQLSMKVEAELPGILNWAIAGCLAWQRDGLGTPSIVRDATAAYRSEMDLIAAWLDDDCELQPHYMTPAQDLYKSYRSWCDDNGERYLSQQLFGKRLKERDFVAHRATGGKRMWRGVRLVTDATQVTFSDPISEIASSKKTLTQGELGKRGHSASLPETASLADDDEPNF